MIKKLKEFWEDLEVEMLLLYVFLVSIIIILIIGVSLDMKKNHENKLNRYHAWCKVTGNTKGLTFEEYNNYRWDLK